MSSIHEIARRAGVSVATVSRVINDRGNIHPDTIEKVNRVIDELNFQPRAKAVTLRHALVLLPSHRFASGDFRLAILGGILHYAFTARILISLRPCPLHIAAGELKQMVRSVGAGGIVLLANPNCYEAAEHLGLENLPHAVIGPCCENDPINRVVFDSFNSCREATEYLLSVGHRRIRLVAFSLDDLDHRNCYLGYRAGMSRVMPEDEVWEPVTTKVPSVEAGAAIIKALWRGGERPTALLVSNATLTLGILQGARELGIDIPGELSLITTAWDDTFATTAPPVTALQLPCSEIGVAALSLLEKQWEGQDVAHQTVVLSDALVMRASVTVPPGSIRV